MSRTPSNPIYEKRQEDWARRAIARKLDVKIVGKRKAHQWSDIVCRLTNVLETMQHRREHP